MAFSPPFLHTSDSVTLFGQSSLQTADGLMAIGPDCRIVYWNRGAQEVLGYAPEEVISRPCYEVIQGLTERGTLLCTPDCPIIRGAHKGAKVRSFELETMDKEGRRLWLTMSTLFITAPAASNGFVFHLFHDVREHRQAQELIKEFALRASQLLIRNRGDTPSPQEPPQWLRRLTPRERGVLHLLTQGLTAKEIAKRLSISEVTIRNHIQHIREKLGVHSQLEAVLYALKYRF